MDTTIVSIVERELGKTPDAVAHVEEGLLHETYVIHCDSGEYVLQFASDTDEDHQDELNHGLHCYLMLQNTDIPVPGVVTNTMKVANGRRYILVEKLPGKTGKRDVSSERVLNAGRYLAKIHNTKSFETAGRIRFDDHGVSVHAFKESCLKQRIQRGVEEHSTDLHDGGLGTVGNAVEWAFDRSGTDVPETFQPVLCHNDYSPDNVLFLDGEVTGILDFDRAYAGHSERDLVKAANGFWMHDPCADWNIRAAFYKGYQGVNELHRSFERTEPLYRVETLAGTIAGLLTMNELSEYEKEFYTEKILQAIERTEEI